MPFLLLLLLAVSIAFTPARAANRVALVIGNSSYEHVAKLPNPPNDAADMAAALGRLGFAVRTETDLTFDAMRRALKSFSEEAEGADMALIYFAGHGFEIGKQNYLIPVDARLASDRDIQWEAIPLDLLQTAVEGAKELKLVLLDACRDNPFAPQMKFASGQRSIGRGLARIDPIPGTLVGFAAKEGTTADDGKGRNSPYTAALLAHLEEPGLELNFLFRKVHDAVLEATNGRQEPFVYGALSGKLVYFTQPADKPKAETAAEPNAAPVAGPSDEVQIEITFWNSIKDTKNPALLEAYFNQYPQGRFVVLARALLKELAARKDREAAAEAAPEPKQALPQPDPAPQVAVAKPPPPALKSVKEKPRVKEKVAVAKPPAPAPAPKIIAVCRSALAKFRSGHAPRAAFAVSADGQQCGWSAGGHANLKSAISEALRQCRTRHPNCRVIATK